MVLAAWILPHDKPEPQKHPFDLTGFLMISPSMMCLLYGIEQSSHHADVRVLVLGLVLLGAFLQHAHRKKSKALIDVELFKIRVFSTAATTRFLAFGIMYGGPTITTVIAITFSLSANVTSASAHTFLVPFATLIMLQLAMRAESA